MLLTAAHHLFSLLDSPHDGPLGGGITTCNAPLSTSVASTCVSTNGVSFGPLASSAALTSLATTGCVTSNGSAATSSSTPCFSPHSPCYPHSPHQYGRGEPNIDINAFTGKLHVCVNCVCVFADNYYKICNFKLVKKSVSCSCQHLLSLES